MEKLISGKALTLRIGALKKNAKAWTAEIEFLAKSACVECVNTRNTSSINRLADATKDIGSRALMRWIAKHGPVTWDTEKKQFVLSDTKHKAMSEDVEAYEAELNKAPSYTAEAKESDSNPFTSYNFEARLKSFYEDAVKRSKDVDRKGKKDKKGNKDNFDGLSKFVSWYTQQPVKMERTVSKKPVAKAKHGKVRKLTAATETVASA